MSPAFMAACFIKLITSVWRAVRPAGQRKTATDMRRAVDLQEGKVRGLAGRPLWGGFWFLWPLYLSQAAEPHELQPFKASALRGCAGAGLGRVLGMQ